MKKVLLIFIDGLQYDSALKNLEIVKSESSSHLISGIGFSNNIYPEIFCGMSPDEIDYFNEWSPKDELHKTRQNKWLNILDSFRGNIYINAGIRKIILKKIFKIDYSNIPFKYVHYFKPQGSHNFKDLGDNSLLNIYKFDIYDSIYYKYSLGKRDLENLNYSINNVNNNHMLVSLLDLDNIAHIYGIDSCKYNNHIKLLNDKLKLLINKFKDINNNPEIFLFSDHGMAKVNKSININIEGHFGNMKPDYYIYFLDSTYLRIWTKNLELKVRIKEYLNSLNAGKILDENIRQEYGITNKKFGDIIFRANEGVFFAPNFYGSRTLKSMHGYDSTLRSQHAIFSDITKTYTKKQLPSTSKNIYNFLKNILNNE